MSQLWIYNDDLGRSSLFVRKGDIVLFDKESFDVVLCDAYQVLNGIYTQAIASLLDEDLNVWTACLAEW